MVDALWSPNRKHWNSTFSTGVILCRKSYQEMDLLLLLLGQQFTRLFLQIWGDKRWQLTGNQNNIGKKVKLPRWRPRIMNMIPVFMILCVKFRSVGLSAAKNDTLEEKLAIPMEPMWIFTDWAFHWSSLLLGLSFIQLSTCLIHTKLMRMSSDFCVFDGSSRGLHLVLQAGPNTRKTTPTPKPLEN